MLASKCHLFFFVVKYVPSSFNIYFKLQIKFYFSKLIFSSSLEYLYTLFYSPFLTPQKSVVVINSSRRLACLDKNHHSFVKR